MSRRIPALVKPELLRWARESAGISTLVRAAELTGFEAITLEEWESGHDAPSLTDLRHLGKVYRRPLAVFFLSEPPRKFDPQKEFRRLPGSTTQPATPELLLALRWAAFRREAAQELHRLTDLPIRKVELRLQLDADPELAGQKIRESLGISWPAQREWSSAHEALREWRGALEASGVLVFQASEVELTEMRATCIPDEPLPLILLNAKDAPYGRIFSLLHEYAHILLHAGGYATSRMAGQRSPEEQPLEVAANAFAAAALLPEAEFRGNTRHLRPVECKEDAVLKQLAANFRVSPEVILRRMVTLGMMSTATYASKRAAWAKHPSPVPLSGSGGPPIYIRSLAQDGRGYSRLVLDAYDQRLISTNTAADYLGLKPQYFPELRQELQLRLNTP